METIGMDFRENTISLKLTKEELDEITLLLMKSDDAKLARSFRHCSETMRRRNRETKGGKYDEVTRA